MKPSERQPRGANAAAEALQNQNAPGAGPSTSSSTAIPTVQSSLSRGLKRSAVPSSLPAHTSSFLSSTGGLPPWLADKAQQPQGLPAAWRNAPAPATSPLQVGFDVPVCTTSGRRSISQEPGQLSGQLKSAEVAKRGAPQPSGPNFRGQNAAGPASRVFSAAPAPSAPMDIFSTSAPVRSSVLTTPAVNEIEPAEEVPY